MLSPRRLSAQTVTQQGWNPKEVLAKETYVKPPDIVERIVTAPRNNVAFTNPSPDHKYFLKTESEGLPSIDVFGKPHYRLGGVEIDYKANRARALTTRGSIGLTLLDPTSGAMRTIETPKGAVVNGATWSPDGKSIGYIASFDARTDIYVADVASGKSTLITAKTPLLAARVTTFDWTADGKNVVAVLLPDGRPAEPKRPPVETGPLVRTSEAGKVLQNRNYASLLRDPYDKDLLDYYTLGQLAMIDVKTKAVEEDRRARADHERRRVARRPVLPRHAADQAVLVPRSGVELRNGRADLGRERQAARRDREDRAARRNGGANDTTAICRAAPGSAAAAVERIRPSATSSGIRSARASSISQSEAGPAGSGGGGARGGAWSRRGPRRRRWRWRREPEGSRLRLVAAVRRGRREAALRGEQPHDVGRVQRRTGRRCS